MTEPVGPGLTEDQVKKEISNRQSDLSKEDSVGSANTIPCDEVVAAKIVKGRKRKAETTPERGSQKRTAPDSRGSGSSAERVRSRSNVDTSSDGSSSPSLREVESLNKNKWNVMFTGYNEQSDVVTVRELQGHVTESVTDCTVLVANQIKRTTKFLSMLAKGVPIVSPSWIVESKKYFRFLDPWDYILTDPPNEKKWGFKLADTLQKAKRDPLLGGKLIVLKYFCIKILIYFL